MKTPGIRSRIATRGGTYALTLTAVVLAILIALNVLASVLPSSLTRLDISAAQLYSVTSSTKAVAAALEQDVQIYWIVQANEEDEVLENLLSRYESLSGHIQVTKKNPDVSPTFTAQYTEEELPNNSLIVESGSKSRVISYYDLYPTEVDYSTYSYVYSFDGEGALTSAIDYVVAETLPKVYLLEGHGEAELSESFRSQIEKENMELESFSLLNTDEVPQDADAVLIYAPERDLSEEEAAQLKTYLDDGGKLMVLAGATEDGTLETLCSVLTYYGVTSVDGLVMDTDRTHYTYYPYVLLPSLLSDEITDPLIEKNYYIVFPLAQGLDITGSGATALLTTSDEAFSKAAGYQFESYELEEGDAEGPFTLGVCVDTGNDGQLVWFSSGKFLEDTYNSVSSGANLDLAMNTLSALIGQREAVSIRTKSLSYNYLTIPESGAAMLKIWMIGVLPGAFVLFGIATVIDRRKKRHA